MANTFQFVDWITMESLRILKNKLEVAQFFNTSYNREFQKEFAVGDTVRVKLPYRATVRSGLGFNPTGIDRQYTTVTVDQIFGSDIAVDSVESALKMERGKEWFKREYIDPTMAKLAQEIDSRAALFAYQNTPNYVGTLGTNPTAFDTTSAAARERMIQLACPPGEKGMIIPPAIERALKNTAITYFNPAGDISKQYKEGSIGRADGFDWYSSMSLYDHTSGVWGSTVSVSGASQSGSSLLLNCTSGDTFKQGDVISIDNVYAVNPMTLRTTTQTQDKQFVITADATATASTVTVQIYPAIVGPGSPYQNVNALPADTAAVSLFGDSTPASALTGKNGLAIHKDAFAIVGVPLEVPKAVEMSSQSRDPETGIAIRFVKMFDPIQSRMVTRFDVLLGFGVLYADSCCVRVLGAS